MVSNERGEYWIILLPGLYHISAEHTNTFGSLVANSSVQVKNYLGEGAKIHHLLLKPRLQKDHINPTFSRELTPGTRVDY